MKKSLVVILVVVVMVSIVSLVTMLVNLKNYPRYFSDGEINVRVFWENVLIIGWRIRLGFRRDSECWCSDWQLGVELH